MIESLLRGNPQQPGAIPRPGIYWWVGPDLVQAGIAERMIRKYLGNLAYYRAAKHTFTLRHNGSEVVVKSADQVLRGEGLMGCVIDEAAQMRDSVYHEDLSPALADHQGFCNLISTPYGFDNWLYQLKQDVERLPTWSYFEAPSWINPKLDRAWLEEQRAYKSPAAFNQEFGGQFCAKDKALFAPEYFTEILTDQFPSSFHQKVIAIDLSMGRVRSDYQAVVFLGRLGDMLYCEGKLFRVDIQKLLPEIMALKHKYDCATLVWENVGFQALAQPLWEALYPEVPMLHVMQNHAGNQSKAARISLLTRPLALRQLKLLDTPYGRMGLNQIRDFPAAPFDDFPDACAMAYQALAEGHGQ